MRLSRRQFVQGAGVAGLGLLAGCGRPTGRRRRRLRSRGSGYSLPARL
jgi:hypothetical protein